MANQNPRIVEIVDDICSLVFSELDKDDLTVLKDNQQALQVELLKAIETQIEEIES